MNADNQTDSDNIAELIRSAGRRPTPSAADYEQVLAATTTTWRGKVNARRRKRWAMAMAASVAVIALLVVPWLRTSSPNRDAIGNALIVRGDVAMMAPGASSWTPLVSGEPRALVPGTRLRTGADGSLAVHLGPAVDLRLSDSSEIQLAALHAIDLNTGTIYLDSGPLATNGQLRIRTRFGELRDIGTQFEVNAGPNALRLRVREGRVVLEDTSGLRLESEAGQQLTLNDGGQLQRTVFRTDDPAWNWAERITPAPELEGQTVHIFLNWVARQSGRRVQFAEPGVEMRARAVRLSSTVNMVDLTPLEILDAVLATTNFAYIIRDDGVILIERR